MRKMKKLLCRSIAVILSFAFCFCCVFTAPADTHADTDADLAAMAEEILLLTNEARIAAGLKPLKTTPYLCDISNVRSRECIFEFSHNRPRPTVMPDGTEEYRFFTVIDDSLVPWTRAAENIAAGSDTAIDTFNQWKKSDNHWATILNPEYTHIGISVAYDSNSEFKFYWEQIFVKVDGSLENEYIPERYKTVPIGLGDINGDNEINTFDLITINKYLEKKIELNDLQKESADLLKDKEITSADASVLRKYLLGEYKSLPVVI
jgi:uncharacterized protein YkwD